MHLTEVQKFADFLHDGILTSCTVDKCGIIGHSHMTLRIKYMKGA
jgi:hypothetical protein